LTERVIEGLMKERGIVAGVTCLPGFLVLA
jgi:hypothetical protein